MTPETMSELGTRRLSDAAASLPPAERALLDLWTQRGLDDEALSAMTGMSAATIAMRRARIVEHLSAELGQAHWEIEDALRGLTETGSEPAAAAEREAQPPAAVKSGGRLRRWLVLAILILVVIVLAVVLRSPSHRGKSGASAPASPAASTSLASRSTAPRPARIQALTALPGGLTSAAGLVSLSGSGHKLKLKLSVSGLPSSHGGHYEVWLYDSILDARALGRLNGGVHTVNLDLPRDAGRYQWIDVSLQPPGAVNHSGESVLRAPNPAHAPPA
jgi:hypothetical protein